MAETKEQTKAELEQKLGRLVMLVNKAQVELQKLQKETNETATAIEKLDG